MHLTIYDGAATHGSPQDNSVILRCSHFFGVPRRGVELPLALTAAQFSSLVVQGLYKLHLICFDQLSNEHFLHFHYRLWMFQQFSPLAIYFELNHYLSIGQCHRFQNFAFCLAISSFLGVTVENLSSNVTRTH